MLAEQFAEGGFPFISLRLPDVIGPRDTSGVYATAADSSAVLTAIPTTDRWINYQLWLLTGGALGIPPGVPRRLETRPLSFVASFDVAALILKLVERPIDPMWHGHAFNLGFHETPTLIELLLLMAKRLGLRDSAIGSASLSFYPSVERGKHSGASRIACTYRFQDQ